MHLAGAHIEIHGIQRGKAREAFGNPAHGKDWLGKADAGRACRFGRHARTFPAPERKRNTRLLAPKPAPTALFPAVRRKARQHGDAGSRQWNFILPVQYLRRVEAGRP